MSRRFYHGRHRTARPTRRGAVAVFASLAALLVVAGSAVTPAVATPAHRPAGHALHPYAYRMHALRSVHVWEKVAACESAHTWHINTHNGYYGGLQFAQMTWVGLGGRKYAPRADLATRLQQIAVARRVLALQGPHAWPVCGKRAHLTRARGLATSTPLPNLPGLHTHRAHKPVHKRRHA